MTAKKIMTEINEIVDACSDQKFKEAISKMRINPQRNQTSYRDELSSLINNYDLASVEIGIFQFLSQYEVTPKFMLFGKIDMDILARDRNSKEIVMLDHDDLEYVMFRCAKDSDTFLDFMSVYCKYMLSQLCDDFNYSVPEKNFIYNMCGGEAYKKFVDFCFD
jgi:hypothetical protein